MSATADCPYLSQSLNQLVLLVHSEWNHGTTNQLKSEEEAEFSRHSGSQGDVGHSPQRGVGHRIKICIGLVCDIPPVTNA